MSVKYPGRIVLFVCALTLGGCIDGDVVFRSPQITGDPPAAAAGFLGYSDTSARRTLCGNCHSGQERVWNASAHAGAVQDLVASGAAQSTCYSCHTVTERGNRVEGDAGYDGTQAGRYHDVQCESCHGPGLQHILDASATQPLASIAVGRTLSYGCGECHRDAHQPFVEEWSQSRHARVNPSVAARKASDPAHWGECAECHEGKEALRVQFGSRAEYVEKSDTIQYAITCAICHDPHGSPETAQLRASIQSRDPEVNLCIRCHRKRAEPDESGRGAHSAQGPVVLGEAGWRPPNFVFADRPVQTTHNSERNPKLCAGCHLNSYAVRDTSGKFEVQATGHLFKAIPCIDASGRPTSDTCDLPQRTFRTCTNAGCHASENAARTATIANEARLRVLTTEVNRLVARVPATEFNTTDGKTTPGEGAKFNASLLDGDTSRGVHNPFLLEALLHASIGALKSTYNFN